VVTYAASLLTGKRIMPLWGRIEVSGIKQDAGQYMGDAFRITWRSWEPTKGASKAPLMLLHPLPHNGSFFARIAPLLAEERFVFAPDYPGYGASWPVPGPPTINLYAQAVLVAWKSRGIAQKPDLFGFHTGCLVAPELAYANAEDVGSMVLVDVPYFSAADCKLKLQEPWAVDGFMAAFSYPAEQRFPLVENECLIIATKSGLFEPSKAAASVLPHCQLLEMPEIAAPALENGAQVIATACVNFLD
jgi:pimeloyl-ACP methyl ester carboxylesterase